jgi:hypothetical protein
MQKYRGFAGIPKAARGANALLLWAKAKLRHAVGNPTRRSRAAVEAPNDAPRLTSSRFCHVMIEVSQRF